DVGDQAVKVRVVRGRSSLDRDAQLLRLGGQGEDEQGGKQQTQHQVTSAGAPASTNVAERVSVCGHQPSDARRKSGVANTAATGTPSERACQRLPCIIATASAAGAVPARRSSASAAAADVPVEIT